MMKREGDKLVFHGIRKGLRKGLAHMLASVALVGAMVLGVGAVGAGTLMLSPGVAHAATTYTTTHTCGNFGADFTATITWYRSGNYERPTNLSWSSTASVSELNYFWEQGSYVAASGDTYYSPQRYSGSIALSSAQYPMLYWPGYDDYVRVYFYGYNHDLLCENKVTD